MAQINSCIPDHLVEPFRSMFIQDKIGAHERIQSKINIRWQEIMQTHMNCFRIGHTIDQGREFLFDYNERSSEDQNKRDCSTYASSISIVKPHPVLADHCPRKRHIVILRPAITICIHAKQYWLGYWRSTHHPREKRLSHEGRSERTYLEDIPIEKILFEVTRCTGRSTNSFPNFIFTSPIIMRMRRHQY